MVDAVITWVDGNDPVHERKRIKYLKEQSPEVQLANTGTRWGNNDEVWYCIKFIRKNAPWIERIFLVTDGQIPYFLDKKSRKHLDVHLVDHSVIFSGYRQFLPTFNSVSIECVLHKIPELSDQFLYFNDDVFMLRKTSYSDYFDDNKLKPRGQLYWVKSRLGRIMKNVTPKLPHGHNDFRGGWENRATRNRAFRCGHAPHPMSRSMMESNFDMTFITSNIKYKFRHEDQQPPIDILFNRGLKKGAVSPGVNDWAYIKPSEEKQGSVELFFEMILNQTSIKTVCIQSLDEANSRDKSFINKQLEYILSI